MRDVLLLLSTISYEKLLQPSQHFGVLQKFERKRLVKVKKMVVQNPFIIECFQNVLCIPFIKFLMGKC